MINAFHDCLDFRFPVLAAPMSWEPLVDTAEPTGRATNAKLYAPGDIYRLKGHSFALFINRAPRPNSSGVFRLRPEPGEDDAAPL